MFKRTTQQTKEGFVTYGAFTAILITDKDGNVTYSNMKPEAKEYQQMLLNNKKFRKSLTK